MKENVLCRPQDLIIGLICFLATKPVFIFYVYCVTVSVCLLLYVCLCCSHFSFLCIMLTDWWEDDPWNDLFLCWVGCCTLSQLISHGRKQTFTVADWWQSVLPFANITYWQILSNNILPEQDAVGDGRLHLWCRHPHALSVLGLFPPLYEKITSSTRPEVHIALLSQEDRAMSTGNI